MLIERPYKTYILNVVRVSNIKWEIVKSIRCFQDLMFIFCKLIIMLTFCLNISFDL